MNYRRIVLTGGHLTPALALINELQKHGWEIYYFGRLKAMQGDKHLSLEAKVIPKNGVNFVPIITGKFPRKFNIKNIVLLLKIPIGIIYCLLLLIKLKPKIVISFGGYLGFPAVVASWLIKIPSVVHEQISVGGLANRLSTPFATKIAISFPTSERFYPAKKTIFIGNPLQPGVFTIKTAVEKKYARKIHCPRTILVMGGNQGAKYINQTVLSALPKLLKKYNLIHQIGSAEAQDSEWRQAQALLSELPKKLTGNYFPTRFIHHEEMGSVYALVDLVVCRSGANTINELGVLRKPALLIPLEPTLMDEQLHNAQLLASAGLAKILPEDNLSSIALINQIDYMIKHLNKFRLGPQYEQIFIKDGAEQLYYIITEIAKP